MTRPRGFERQLASAVPVLLAALLSACHGDRPEPAPAPTEMELVPAPPGALGAHAAGTDAAPPPPSEQQLPADPEEESDDEEAPPDAAAPTIPAPDAGAGPGVTL